MSITYNQWEHVLEQGTSTFGVGQSFLTVTLTCPEKQYEPSLLVTPIGAYENWNVFVTGPATWNQAALGGKGSWEFVVGRSSSGTGPGTIQWQAIGADPLRYNRV